MSFIKLPNLVEADRWDDMQVNGFAMAAGASAPSLVTFGPSGGLLAYAYAGSGPAQSAHFSVQFSHMMKESPAYIYPHVHWSPVNANAGNVKWFLEYTWANVNGTFAEPVTLPIVQASDQVAWKHQIVSFAPIVGTGKTISSILMCRLYRNSADDEDTYGSNAVILQCDFHYLLDSLGSEQELSKNS